MGIEYSNSTIFDCAGNIYTEIDVTLICLRRIEEKVTAAMEIVADYGGIDGGHHKQYALDQIARALLGDQYESWVKNWEHGDDGPNTYRWDEGIP